MLRQPLAGHALGLGGLGGGHIVSEFILEFLRRLVTLRGSEVAPSGQSANCVGLIVDEHMRGTVRFSVSETVSVIE